MTIYHMNKNILTIENLSVEFDHEKIVDNLSFTVEQGDIVAIVGPNGAGKTVLMRTLLGFLPYTGKITWSQQLRKSYVPQRLPLIKDIPITVAEFFHLKIKNKLPDAPLNILASVGLDETILNKLMTMLTPGQYQRILMAWQLINDPEIMFFDEPMEGIDASGQQSIYKFLGKIHKEKNLTIILVSHDLSVVYKLATKVICLNRNLVCYGMPKEALTVENLNKLYGGETKFYQHDHHHD
jgi:zinc transport system ATP-binding protein